MVSSLLANTHVWHIVGNIKYIFREKEMTKNLHPAEKEWLRKKSMTNPPQEPTNDLREQVSRMIIENRNPAGSIHGFEQQQLLEDILTLLARRQNELIDEILGQLPEETMNQWFGTDGESDWETRIRDGVDFDKGYNAALSEVTALLNKMKGE